MDGNYLKNWTLSVKQRDSTSDTNQQSKAQYSCPCRRLQQPALRCPSDAIGLRDYCLILRSISSIVMPAISIVFCRLVAPRTICIARFGTSRRSASNATNASLAAPSTGGAVKRALSMPCSHSRLFLLLRGMTRTVMSIHLPVWWKRLE